MSLTAQSYSRAGTLGEGSFGQVCVVYRDSDGERLAGKAFDEDDKLGGLSLETVRELSALSALGAGHPNVTRLVDLALTFEGAPCALLVMPLYGGGPVDGLIGAGLPASRRLDICLDVLAALAYVHSRGLMHRDVKPENVVIDDAGERPTAVLVDFGFARLLAPDRMHTAVVGTPCYTAPELLAGRRGTARYGEACDLYSCGVLALELLRDARGDWRRDRSAMRAIQQERERLAEARQPSATLRSLLSPEPRERCAAREALEALGKKGDDLPGQALSPPRGLGPGEAPPEVEAAMRELRVVGRDARAYACRFHALVPGRPQAAVALASKVLDLTPRKRRKDRLAFGYELEVLRVTGGSLLYDAPKAPEM